MCALACVWMCLGVYLHTLTRIHTPARICVWARTLAHAASEVIILFFLVQHNTAFRVSISRIVLSSYDDDDVRRITRHILIQFYSSRALLSHSHLAAGFFSCFSHNIISHSISYFGFAITSISIRALCKSWIHCVARVLLFYCSQQLNYESMFVCFSANKVREQATGNKLIKKIAQESNKTEEKFQISKRVKKGQQIQKQRWERCENQLVKTNQCEWSVRIWEQFSLVNQSSCEKAFVFNSINIIRCMHTTWSMYTHTYA